MVWRLIIGLDLVPGLDGLGDWLILESRQRVRCGSGTVEALDDPPWAREPSLFLVVLGLQREVEARRGVQEDFFHSLHVDTVTVHAALEVLQVGNQVVALPFATRQEVVPEEHARHRPGRELRLLRKFRGCGLEVHQAAERDLFPREAALVPPEPSRAPVVLLCVCGHGEVPCCVWPPLRAHARVVKQCSCSFYCSFDRPLCHPVGGGSARRARVVSPAEVARSPQEFP